MSPLCCSLLSLKALNVQEHPVHLPLFPELPSIALTLHVVSEEV